VDKFPVSPATLKVSTAHNPADWLDYETAARMADMCGLGLAFVFSDKDPFFFLDIDGAWDGKNWSPVALELCSALSGCAVEVSYSGKGLHVFGTGVAPGSHGCKNVPLGLELYTTGRFVALTGTGLIGDAAFCPMPMAQVVQNYFSGSSCGTAPGEWTNEPAPEWSGPQDDAALLEKMLRSRSASAVFGGRASIQDLWAANADALSQVYPSQTGADFDHSSADAAMCAHLAFWTGKDCERMDRLFRMSGLVRGKWLDREDYRQRTILSATGRCTEVYGGKQKTQDATTAQPESAGIEGRSGFQFLSTGQQAEFFKGCVYIRDLHKVLTPDGALLKPDQFRAMYGGYVFALDAMNDKTTRSAWEAFTENQGAHFPKAFAACFRPERPPGEIIMEEGGSLVNTYVPIKVERRVGDATPFLNHLEKLLPLERDRAILLAYMAACAQYPGTKFQWCPLLQGVEGNGKTLLFTCIAAAVGWRYAHTPNTNDLVNKFNSWLLGKLIIGVEEIYISDRKEAIEALKPMITNPKIEIQGKGINQITGDNRANFFMCTNHKDGVRKTGKDRRYCIFYTAQQTKADLGSSKMGGSYFPRLYEWLKTGGYAIVSEFLHTYPIPDEFNPAAACHRAPDTSSTREAILLSQGGLEQELYEAIEEGRYGFAGDWISSITFGWIIKERKDEKRITPHKRREILEDLGYILHPYLKDGRVNNAIAREAGRPKLYVTRDHPSLMLRDSSAIARAYQLAQEGR
jgi:hypothetical protein